MGIRNANRKSSSTLVAGIWLAAILPLLTACGGGGGGDSTVIEQTSSTPLVSTGTTTTTATSTSTSSLKATLISSGPAAHRDVDINKVGTAVAVWVDDQFGRGITWSNRFEYGRWGTPAQISTSNETTAPRVSINSQGEAVAVWEDRHYVSTLEGGTDVTVLVSRYQGGAWTEPTQVSAWVTHGQAAPVVGIDDAGHAIVAWLQEEQGSIRPSVWQASYDGSAWSQPKRLSDGIHAASRLKLEMNAAGNAVVAWEQHTNNFDEPGYKDADSNVDGYAVPNMWAANYVGGEWSAASLIGDPMLVKEDMCTSVDLAMNERGSAVATCWQRKGVVESIVMNTFEPGLPGSWSAAPSVVTVLPDTEYHLAHAVALANDGGVLVGLTASQPSTMDRIVSVHRYDAASASWAQPLQLSGDVNSRAFVEYDGADTGHVVWEEGGDFGKWKMHRFSPSTGWDVAQTLPVPFMSGDIQLAVAGNGFGVMVFEMTNWAADLSDDWVGAFTWP